MIPVGELSARASGSAQPLLGGHGANGTTVTAGQDRGAAARQKRRNDHRLLAQLTQLPQARPNTLRLADGQLWRSRGTGEDGAEDSRLDAEEVEEAAQDLAGTAHPPPAVRPPSFPAMHG